MHIQMHIIRGDYQWVVVSKCHTHNHVQHLPLYQTTNLQTPQEHHRIDSVSDFLA